MAKQRKRIKPDEAQVDMLPMIDLTFLLVMFFVLTSSFSPTLEDIQLPVALSAAESDGSDIEDGVIIINLKKVKDSNRKAEIRYQGRTLTPKQLVDVLKKEARYHAERKGWTGKWSRLTVRLRADEGARGNMLREVFMACSRANIWKVKLSAEHP